MARRIEAFDVTIAAGVLQASPATTNLVFSEGIVTNIEVLVPPGPSGLVGFAFTYGGHQVIPNTAGQFIISDGEVIDWPVEGFPTGGQWQLRAFNTDIFSHTLHLRLLVEEFPAPPVPVPVPLTIPLGGPATEAAGLEELAAEGEAPPVVVDTEEELDMIIEGEEAMT